MAVQQTPYRVALIDDHPAVLAGLRGYLEQCPEFKVVLEAADGVEYERMAADAGHIHLAVVDLLMPRRDGTETMQWMMRHQTRTRALGYSYQFDAGQIRRALAADMRGLLLKDQPLSELRRALVEVATTGFH